jgi:hypothetical protein
MELKFANINADAKCEICAEVNINWEKFLTKTGTVQMGIHAI